MKTLVAYDSWYSNTEKIARAICDTLGKDASVVSVQDDMRPDLHDVDLLIVGSPTHGGVATPAMEDFMHYIRKGELDGISAAAFDTRVPSRWVRIIGFAAKRIGKGLADKGAEVIDTEGFIVKHKKGPLKEGELDRAKSWAAGLPEKAKSARYAKV